MRENVVDHRSRQRKFLLVLLLLLLVIIGILLLLLLLREQPKPVPKDMDRPYGFTVLDIFRPQTVTYLKQLDINWIRYQENWSRIEPERGKFNWSQLDAAVALANANRIHMTFPLQIAPAWALRQSCANRLLFPGADEMANFGRTVAERYNGTHGHGYIESYEVGNEDFDSLWTGNWNESISCRKPDFYGPVLKATYPAIKAASPNALVGMGSIWWVNLPHDKAYMQWLYQHNEGAYFDFANYHYYVCDHNPTSSTTDQPSFEQEWQTIHDVMKNYGDGDKPIWVTEVGWSISKIQQDAHCTVPPETQAQYITQTAQTAMTSHVIRHIFWYTIDRGDDGMSLTQPDGNLPAFTSLQGFIRRYPKWNP